MPNPEEWYNHPDASEIIYPLFETELTEKRIRIRFRTKSVGKKGKKDIQIFSVGLEMNIKGNWADLVRHCNHHSESTEQFHTHNKYKLPCLGNKTKITMKLPKKKTPASQMRWAIKDIKNNYSFYRKEFFRSQQII